MSRTSAETRTISVTRVRDLIEMRTRNFINTNQYIRFIRHVVMFLPDYVASLPKIRVSYKVTTSHSLRAPPDNGLHTLGSNLLCDVQVNDTESGWHLHPRTCRWRRTAVLGVPSLSTFYIGITTARHFLPPHWHIPSRYLNNAMPCRSLWHPVTFSLWNVKNELSLL
jgi:hypothetical protein